MTVKQKAPRVQSEDLPEYKVDFLGRADALAREDDVIREALNILVRRLHNERDVFSTPAQTRDYLTLRYATEEQEVFSAVFLNAQHRMLAHVDLFNGTLTQCSVYPREVVKSALKINAGAVIFCHNHPSGLAEASSADIALTRVLKESLAMVDVRVLDHIIVAGTSTLSMAERGLI